MAAFSWVLISSVSSRLSRMARQQFGLAVIEVVVELCLETANIFHAHVIQEAVAAGVDDGDLFFHRHRRIGPLFQNFHPALTAVQLILRGLVEIGTKLREGFQTAILSQFQAQFAGDGSHRFDLCAAADAAHGKTDVDGRADVRVKQIAFEIDLAVGDGDDVGGNVGRNVAGLGFDKRQSRKRAAAFFIAEFSGALEQAAVKIEHVAGKRFAAWRTAQQQGNFAISGGVLRKIVVNAKRVAFGIAEKFTDGAAGIRRDVLHGRGIGRGGGDNDGISHGAMLFE